MKRRARAVVIGLLGWQVRRLRRKHDFKTIGVVGSIGKTSTKFAIAQVLAQHYRVRFEAGNYNDLVTVPLVFFDQTAPSLFNPLAWIWTLLKNEAKLWGDYPYDVVVVEVGTDGPGQIAQFAKYLQIDLTVVTALTQEHMENFDDLVAVAREELSAASYSHQLLINLDLCPGHFLDVDKPVTTYGSQDADYQLKDEVYRGEEATFTVRKGGKHWLKARMEAVAKSQLYSATAAAAVADKLGLKSELIRQGISQIQPVSGRMQRLKGLHDSLILDETYNASPVAVKAALDGLYMMKAPQKIAILGNMNELGKFSADAHTEVGKYCEPRQLDLVVTIGPDANKYLAPAAAKRGCTVKTFTDPYEAGEFVKSELLAHAVVLAKGSQNKVFAEEAVKVLLANPEDAQQLVRQSRQWLKKKRKNFKSKV